MPRFKEQKPVTIIRRVIVCSVCGTESSYRTESQIKMWGERDWYCDEHKPILLTNHARKFWVYVQHKEQGRSFVSLRDEMKLSYTRVRQLYVQADAMLHSNFIRYGSVYHKPLTASDKKYLLELGRNYTL